MPSYSTGFCVASVMNGRSSGYETPSIVTWSSCMHSSSAACVFGDARLISSTSRMFAKTGPGAELELVALLVEDVDAGDVGRQQVGRELQPREAAVDRARERLRQHRLPDAGEVLDDQVPLGDEAQHAQAQRLARARARRAGGWRRRGRSSPRRLGPQARLPAASIALQQARTSSRIAAGDRAAFGARFDVALAVGARPASPRCRPRRSRCPGRDTSL